MPSSLRSGDLQLQRVAWTGDVDEAAAEGGAIIIGGAGSTLTEEHIVSQPTLSLPSQGHVVLPLTYKSFLVRPCQGAFDKSPRALGLLTARRSRCPLSLHVRIWLVLCASPTLRPCRWACSLWRASRAPILEASKPPHTRHRLALPTGQRCALAPDALRQTARTGGASHGHGIQTPRSRTSCAILTRAPPTTAPPSASALGARRPRNSCALAISFRLALC